MSVADFHQTLTRLGLAQYHDGFVSEAFDSWDVLSEITEKDLDAFGVKLGHRRVLQRAITQYRREGVRSLAMADSHPDDKNGSGRVEAYLKTDDSNNGVSVTSRPTTGGKRKYRRHPKVDDNAPDRPPSAYVLFSNQVRESLKGQELSFTEIAKTVGERWQILPPDEKATYESRSQAAKDTYYSQLAEYKKTSGFAEYQKYLTEFKAKHEGPSQDAKRKREDQPDTSGRKDSDDRGGSSPGNSTHSSDRHHSTIGSPVGTTRVEWQAPGRFDNMSPDTRQFNMLASESSGFSPRHTTTPGFTAIKPPQAQSPRPSLSSQRSSNYDFHTRSEHPMAISTSLAYGYVPLPPSLNGRVSTLSNQSSTSPPLHANGSHDESTSLPPIRRPDLLNSSESPFGSATSPGPGSFQRGLPNRQLPPPVPSRLQGGHRPPPIVSPISEHLPQHSPGIASLLRAGEHLASAEARSPPAVDSKGPDNSVSNTRDAKPP